MIALEVTLLHQAGVLTSPASEPCCMRHSRHHAVHKPRRVSPKSFQKPHQRKQGDHISCRGSPGIPPLLFLLSRSHLTHCFDWQNFQRRAQGLLQPSSFFHACLSVSLRYCFLLALFTLSQDVSHEPSSDMLLYSHSPLCPSMCPLFLWVSLPRFDHVSVPSGLIHQ